MTRSFLMLLVAISAGFHPLTARATLPPGTDGCNYIGGGQAGIRQDGSELPYCESGGTGCYECCVAEQDQSGWLFCTEVLGNVNCSAKQTEFPDWWPDPDPTDHGQPGDNLPPGTDPPTTWTGDDNGGADPGDGGGGFDCGADCHYDYGAHRPTYGKLVPKHQAYRP